MKGVLLRIATVISLLIVSTSITHAHQPAIEDSGNNIEDPTFASQAVYGTLDNPGSIDEYVFTTSKDDVIPIEVLVPARNFNKNFHPYLAIISENLEGGIVFDEATRMLSSISLPPFEIEDGQSIIVVPPPNIESRKIFYEPFSFENLYSGNEYQLTVEAGQSYKIVVYDPTNSTGTYTIGLGSVENFENENFAALLSNVFYTKALHTVNDTNWIDIWGAFFMIAGLIIGLGAVTVIDWHGLLAQKSKYWTEATIRSHKITKPLIWLGILIHTLGLVIIYRQSFLSGVSLFQLIIIITLILNGLYLSFIISPKLLKLEKNKNIKILPQKLQNKIFISFIISFVFWWSEVFLTIWYLTVLS